MIDQKRYLDKAINEIKQWRDKNVEATNYSQTFSNSIIYKLNGAKKADSIEELDRQIKAIYRYKSDSGPLAEIMPSLNELGVAIEKIKSRSK